MKNDKHDLETLCNSIPLSVFLLNQDPRNIYWKVRTSHFEKWWKKEDNDEPTTARHILQQLVDRGPPEKEHVPNDQQLQQGPQAQDSRWEGGGGGGFSVKPHLKLWRHNYIDHN